ncbi:MAG TPA: hypothetical protein VMR18_05065 [Candidatus Saccharimonadales bacterium]|nr:hypothetical protein [Candidatus Saccharimonadales bacterium]
MFEASTFLLGSSWCRYLEQLKLDYSDVVNILRICEQVCFATLPNMLDVIKELVTELFSCTRLPIEYIYFIPSVTDLLRFTLATDAIKSVGGLAATARMTSTAKQPATV